MSDTGHKPGTPGLGPALLTRVVTSLGNVGAPDGTLGRLFDLPDTQAGVNIYRRLNGQGSDAALVRCCAAAHQMAAQWFGTVRPQAIAAIEAVQRYSAQASASCGTLRALLANSDIDPKVRQHAVAIIEELASNAVEESRTWAALSGLVALLVSQMQTIIPEIVQYDREFNIWDVDPYETQGPMDQGILQCTTLFQQMEGAWTAFGDDAASVARALRNDVENAPKFIAQLGLDEAQGDWQDLAASAGRTLPAHRAGGMATTTQLGWMTVAVSGSNDRYLDYRLQTGPDGAVAFGKDSGESVEIERLSGDQCGYFRIRFLKTDRYLTSSGSGAMLQADWADSERQKWRPIQINQFGLNGCTISGFCLLEHTSGLFAYVDAPFQFSPLQGAGDRLLSLAQKAGLPMPSGLAVFQATTDPFGSVY